MALPSTGNTEDLAGNDDSDFNPASDIYGGRKGNGGSIRFWNRKAKLLVGSFIILALIFLTVLFILEITKSTETLRPVKAKRFAKNYCNEESKSQDFLPDDIHVIPEKQSGDFARRAGQHPNHRYLEIQPEGDIYKKMKNSYVERGRSPKPFDVNAGEYDDNVRNVMSEKKPRDKNMRSNFPNPKALKRSMRFKVFGYIPPKERTSHASSENFYYSKEINNLMQNYSGAGGEEDAAVKKNFKSQGAPFRVPVKDVTGRDTPNTRRPDSSKTKQSWKTERFRKRPLTILLDIYPMTEDYIKKEEPKLSGATKPFRNEVTKSRDVHSARKFLFPRERRNGIIMKLNLYTKQRKFPRHQNALGETNDAIHSTNGRKKAEKKSFGWFSGEKKTKQETKEYSLTPLKHHGKDVTVKRKNENGEWIHA